MLKRLSEGAAVCLSSSQEAKSCDELIADMLHVANY